MHHQSSVTAHHCVLQNTTEGSRLADPGRKASPVSLAAALDKLDGILYITLRAPGSSWRESETWLSANGFVLPTHSQTACPGQPLPLLPAEETSFVTWAIPLNIALFVLQYEKEGVCVCKKEGMGWVWAAVLFLLCFAGPQKANQMLLKRG